MRIIPATMATQHPDNASAPYWERDGDGFVSVHEELDECVSSMRDLGTQEFMWDWEGKYADEAVVDRLFAKYYDYFRRAQLGRDKFLTFRIPNFSREPGYSLMRSLMVILTAEDFADDLGFHSPPLFEVILPMVEDPRQPMYIQDAYEKLAIFKVKTFTHHKSRHREHLELIPLAEGVEEQMAIRKFYEEYVALHRKRFGSKPPYLRPFLARSDPALVSGLPATMLANKIALSDLDDFSRAHHIPCYPIIGVGSLPFRGGLNPNSVGSFLREYGGVRTVTIQSAFRYDYPLPSVKKAVRRLNQALSGTKTLKIDRRHRKSVEIMVGKFAGAYQTTLQKVLPDLNGFFEAVPRRRERHLHIGLLSYKRAVGKKPLPRAINFTAALYSLGVPPEFIGFGRTAERLSPAELSLLRLYYRNLKQDLDRAGRYLNLENLQSLARHNRAWFDIVEDIEALQRTFQLTLGPRTASELMHKHLSCNLYLQRTKPAEVSRLIVETGKLRRSLG